MCIERERERESGMCIESFRYLHRGFSYRVFSKVEETEGDETRHGD